jgi:kinesin family protein 2/24
MHPDMVHMFMNHHDFSFDEAFGETVGNDAVYAGTAQGIVSEAMSGGNGTVMMYGQTGSGKTYTMSAIHERVAQDLFAKAVGGQVTICFVELLGDKCFDMLNQGAPCTLSSAADGSVHPYPSVEVPVNSGSELLALLDLATKLRATAATGVHDQSSRSHAVCRIFIDCGSRDGTTADVEGCLTLVDLAGSEHRIDNAEHNAERRKEGAKINASLAALKECIRATAAGAKFVAFRQNRLTQLLRGCFAGAEQHHTVVIATASPSSKDTEHTLNTLRHACIMDGQGESKSGESAHVSGGAVTKEKLGEIDITKIARERRAARKSEGGEQKPDEWGKKPPAHQAKQSNTPARAALDAKFVRALPRSLGHALLEARQVFGTERQRARMTRAVIEAEAPESRIAPKHEASQSDAPRRARSAHVEGTNPPPVPVKRLSTPALSTSLNGSTERTMDSGSSQLSAEHERALDLFRVFCTRGRDAHAWRKNDLRLINSCVVRLLYGNDAQIDWSHPNIALDQLETLVGDAPPPAHFLTEPVGHDEETVSRTLSADQNVVARPPVIPTNSSAPSTTGKRLAAGSTRSADRRTEQGEIQQPVSRGDGSRPACAREASPASRGASPDTRPLTHQDAIRARRQALEKARQQSLQKALDKNMRNAGMTRGEEISSIQEQLEHKNCSAAAAVGLKKRLAASKASALREERKRISSSTSQVDVSSPAERERVERAHSASGLGIEESSGALAAASMSIDAVSPAGTPTNMKSNDDLWPEPAKPPPRNSLPAPCRASAEIPFGLVESPPPTRVGTGGRRRTPMAREIGAASAPWANAFSNEVAAQG